MLTERNRLQGDGAIAEGGGRRSSSQLHIQNPRLSVLVCSDFPLIHNWEQVLISHFPVPER